MRVLLVEDSPRLLRDLTFALEKRGFAVDACSDGTEALWMAKDIPYDVVLLDIMLPGTDGLSVLRTLRQREIQIPILLLTAKGEVEDRVTGLEAGADDYLTKPFAVSELLARVDALVRRGYRDKNPIISIGDLDIQTAGRVVSRAGVEINLTPREYRTLEFLAQRRGKTSSKADIEMHLYDDDSSVLSNTVESTVSALRRKLWAGQSECPLRTQRGHGYLIVNPK
ncbi:MAG: response regulator transcription factor [Akkermansiaceae bacterium]